MNEIVYRSNPQVTNHELNEFFRACWPEHQSQNLEPVLERSLTYLCAYQAEQIIGFIYLAWDGADHAFVLDPTVHPDLRRRGIGRELVVRAADEARRRGLKWLHVDFEPHLQAFYYSCGFSPSYAGTMRLNDEGLSFVEVQK